MDITKKTGKTHWARIYIAGDRAKAEDICRRYCNEVGLCVNISDTTFIYTGGAQDGVRIELINYPKYPSSILQIHNRALDLMERLMKELHQKSCTIQSSEMTIYYERSDLPLRKTAMDQLAKLRLD